MVKYNPSLGGGKYFGVLRLMDQGFLIHQRKDLLSGGHGGLKGAELIGKGLDGLKKGFYIAGKNVERADGQRPMHDLHAAKAQHRCKGENADKIDQRPEGAIDHDLTEVGLKQVRRALGELPVLFILPVEDLDQLHGRQIFREVGIHGGDLCAGDPVGGPVQPGEQPGQVDHQRQ